jgi:hypothetical protein
MLIMKRYYNPTTKEWYTEGNSITKNISNGVFSGIPSEQRLTEWGFEEYIEPTPTPEELLARAKADKIAELEAYDDSEVNSFSVNGKDMWLDHDLRQQLRISLDALSQAGRETVTKWFDGVEYTYPIDVWYYMLGQVEVYASDALNVTEAHKAAINALESVDDVEAYQFSGYPEKLSFGE